MHKQSKQQKKHQRRNFVLNLRNRIKAVTWLDYLIPTMSRAPAMISQRKSSLNHTGVSLDRTLIENRSLDSNFQSSNLGNSSLNRYFSSPNQAVSPKIAFRFQLDKLRSTNHRNLSRVIFPKFSTLTHRIPLSARVTTSITDLPLCRQH